MDRNKGSSPKLYIGIVGLFIRRLRMCATSNWLTSERRFASYEGTLTCHVGGIADASDSNQRAAVTRP